MAIRLAFLTSCYLLLTAVIASGSAAQTPESTAYNLGYSCGSLLVLGIVLWIVVKVFQFIVRLFRG